MTFLIQLMHIIYTFKEYIKTATADNSLKICETIVVKYDHHGSPHVHFKNFGGILQFFMTKLQKCSV